MATTSDGAPRRRRGASGRKGRVTRRRGTGRVTGGITGRGGAETDSLPPTPAKTRPRDSHPTPGNTGPLPPTPEPSGKGRPSDTHPTPGNTGPMGPNVPDAPTPGTPGTPPPAGPGTPGVPDEYAALQRMFDEYGLGSLWSRAQELITQYGYDGGDNSALWLMLEQEPAFKERFKANEQRVKAGLSRLSPGEYVKLEKQYRDLMKTAGLPKGFYDSTDDFTSWIGGDVSPAEAQDRVVRAADVAASADPELKKALFDLYGVGEDGITAYFLDPEKATSVLDRQANAARFRAAAGRNGVGVTRDTAELAALNGINEQQARQGFAQVGAEAEALGNLGLIYGDRISTDENVDATFGLSQQSQAVQKRKARLASQERAAFSGSGGVSRSSLARQELAL